ncbi:MAG: excinuclease ABC subunit UvrA [Bacteroidetes bacterium]|nr:MAG: excinuclease ABC subunit UvrA [Bacteroidota bacterium]
MKPEKRTTIEIRGARVHNLQNISLEIPRDQLVVITGLSGSGKSSLAFDTLYAEGQRRYMQSLSSHARRFVEQIARPDVDFVFGLSPVISIEQKTIARNPRSTVGTMTDVSNYLNLLYATIADARSPYTGRPIPLCGAAQLLEVIAGLPEGTALELRAPVFPVYGEELDFLFTEIRKKGYKYLSIDGKRLSLSDVTEVAATSRSRMEVIVDRLVVQPGREKEYLSSIQNAFLLGDPYLRLEFDPEVPRDLQAAFFDELGCDEAQLLAEQPTPNFFMFNDAGSACRTCLGLGTYMRVHPALLIPDPGRSIVENCFVKEAVRYSPDNWHGRHTYSMALHYGFDLHTPFGELPERIQHILLYGSGGEKYELKLPPNAKARTDPQARGAWYRMLGKPIGFDGIAARIERNYKWYRQRQVANSGMEEWLKKVMVEHPCPDCGGARLKASRLQFFIHEKNIHQMGEVNFAELRELLNEIKPAKNRQAGSQILNEIRARLDLLLGIGLDYLNFNRPAGTLSGGEAQRIRLSTQIGSGLMGMLYVLDEPSIGLHPKDNAKMIATLRRLRDLGNTLIVVEHDEETIRSADYLVEMGPGPGIHGGRVVVQGGLEEVMACVHSPTGQFLSGKKSIPIPARRREGNGRQLLIQGAAQHNLKHIDVRIPLGMLLCITGASGSGKSTLVHDILYKALYNHLYDSRVIAGAHQRIVGMEHIGKLTYIDQSPLGRNSRSNPATYVGFFDHIRKLFARAPLAVARGYKAGRFSFNVKGGRCTECSGEGSIRTQLYFMPDIERLCESCKGARFNPQTLQVTYRGKNIAEVLGMSIEEGVDFFREEKTIYQKLSVLYELGLGYLTLGQSSTTLSGGEAQRVKLAAELGKMHRSTHTLYVLDEPTTGLHLADISRLLDCLNRLVEAGHSVLLIEHQLDVIKTADYLIDLGPEGGHKGGEVLVCGTPEEVAACKHSHTGRFLRPLLERAD